MKNLENLVLELSKELDIPETYYEKAEISYKSFATWLERENSEFKDSIKEVFLQGSFKLGTVVKPISEADEYDIDMVCKFDISKDKITQKELKDKLGREVKLYAKSKNMLNTPQESKRCWTLNYEDSAKFHIDILPAIPNSNNFEGDYSKYINAIPDKSSAKYDEITSEWEITNPHGYYLWFNKRMELRRKALYESANIEEIPKDKRKTVLQRVIQILKRHRDVMFDNDKPSSIIISTLAASSYNGEEELLEAITNVVNNMEKFIVEKNREIYIYNPVNLSENFADKWKEDGKKKNNFYIWLAKLKKDFKYLVEKKNDIIWLRNDIKSIFGEKTIDKIYARVEEKFSLDFPHKKKPLWEMNLNDSAKVMAYKEKNGYRKKMFFSGEELNKEIKLTFEIETNIPKPYDVYWQVTNSGKEAELSHCLRGDFYDCEKDELIKGKKLRREKTLYIGIHTVECYVLKNNICLARSFPFVVNIIDRKVEF